jgi:hypothetical protein
MTEKLPVTRGSVDPPTALEGRVVHVPDVLEDPEYTLRDLQDIAGYRAGLGAPLLREQSVVGVIIVTKAVPQPFTAKQIELLATFADQAVIAIENTRLLNELRESLQQQTATADVLGVISSSPGQLAPVFEAMLANATRPVRGRASAHAACRGDEFRRVALHKCAAAVCRVQRKDATHSSISGMGSCAGRRHPASRTLADTAIESPDEPIAIYGGARTLLLIVPMLREG